jgi:hypothetical protein
MNTTSSIEKLRKASVEKLSVLSDRQLEDVAGGAKSSSSPMLACCNGKHIARATLTVR